MPVRIITNAMNRLLPSDGLMVNPSPLEGPVGSKTRDVALFGKGNTFTIFWEGSVDCKLRDVVLYRQCDQTRCGF